jgi:hypothetical protein
MPALVTESHFGTWTGNYLLRHPDKLDVAQALTQTSREGRLPRLPCRNCYLRTRRYLYAARPLDMLRSAISRSWHVVLSLYCSARRY